MIYQGLESRPSFGKLITRFCQKLSFEPQFSIENHCEKIILQEIVNRHFLKIHIIQSFVKNGKMEFFVWVLYYSFLKDFEFLPWSFFKVPNF